jgi:hypothetical protein
MAVHEIRRRSRLHCATLTAISIAEESHRTIWAFAVTPSPKVHLILLTLPEALTYMSIDDRINQLCTSGKLIRVLQSWAGFPEARRFYASQSVSDLILGTSAGKDQGFKNRAYELRAEIDHFIDGKLITARPDGEMKRRGWLARLEPTSDEIWEIRSLSPKPSIRILGSIAKKNVFVGLTWARRKDLGGKESDEWMEAIDIFKAEWLSCFGTLRPMSGDYPHDYLTNIRLI